MLANDDLACPNCGTKFEVDFSEDDDACEGCEGCGGKDEDKRGSPRYKCRKSPSARRAEGLFCFVGMQGEAQTGEGAPVLFTPVFYRAACVRQYTA